MVVQFSYLPGQANAQNGDEEQIWFEKLLLVQSRFSFTSCNGCKPTLNDLPYFWGEADASPQPMTLSVSLPLRLNSKPTLCNFMARRHLTPSKPYHTINQHYFLFFLLIGQQTPNSAKFITHTIQCIIKKTMWWVQQAVKKCQYN